MNRRSLLTLASAMSVATWASPVINTVILPAHAQTSCPSLVEVDVTGLWKFNDNGGRSFYLNFLSNGDLFFGSENPPQLESSWARDDVGNIYLDVTSPKGSWVSRIDNESNCLATKITIYDLSNSGHTYQLPIIGARL